MSIQSSGKADSYTAQKNSGPQIAVRYFLSRTSFSALEAERSKKYMSNTYRLFGRIFGGLALNFFVEQSRTISEQIQNKIHLSAVSVVMDFL